MEQFDETESHPIEDALHRAQAESFIALHRDTGMMYAVCRDPIGCSDLLQPVVMIHHKDDLAMVCHEHYITMCIQHSGPMVEMQLLWARRPLRVYAN